MNYYDQQARRLQQMAAMRMMLARQGQQAAGPMEIARNVASRGKAHWAYNTSPGSATKPEHKKHGFAGFLDKIPWAIAPGAKLASEALDTSPARAVLDVLSRGNYASAGWSEGFQHQQELAEKQYEQQGHGDAAGEILSWLRPYFSQEPYEQALEGLKGKDKKTYKDVIEQRTGDTGKSAAALGLGLDIAGDPLNLVPVGGTAAVVGRTASRVTKVAKPLEVAAEVATKGEPITDSHARLIEKVLKAQSNPMPKAAPIEITPSQVVDTAEMDKLNRYLKQVPIKRDINIPAPFKTVEEEVPAAAVEKTSLQKDKLARARAIKATILQDEGYKIGKYPVGQMLKAAQKNPETAQRVDKLINNHVKEVLKSGDTSNLPGRAQLYGRSGEKAAFGLDLDRLTDLMRNGHIGGSAKYGEESDEFLGQFPIHSADDLESVSLNNAKGEKVSLGQYLRDLGVELKAVDTAGTAKEIKFGGVKFPEFNAPKIVPATRKVKREVRTEIDWAPYVDRLTTEERKRLQNAKTRTEFEQITKEIALSTKAQEFKSVADFIAASKDVDPKWLKSVLHEFGVKSPEELQRKVDKLLKGVTPKEVKSGLVEGKAPVPSRVERILGPVAADDFGSPVKTAEELIENGASISYTLPKLTEDQLKDLSKALPAAVVENLVDPADIAKYPWMTDLKRAKRTSKTPGEGRARNLHGWHSYSQMAIFKDVMRSAATRHPVPRNLRGKEAASAFKQRSSELYDEVMPTLAAAETALRREGVNLISGTDNAGMMLSLSDVLQSLPRELVEKHLFNPRTSVLPTDFLKAGDNIVRALTGQIDYVVARENVANIFKTSPKISALKNAKHRDSIVRGLTEAIVDNSDVILQRVEANYARVGIETGKAVQSMTDDVIRNVVTKYADPNVSIGEALGDFAMRNSDISAAGRAVKAPTDAYGAAKAAADVQLAGVFKPGDFSEAKHANDMLKVMSEKEAASVGVKQSASRSAEALDSITPTVDLGDRYQAQLQGNLFRANVPLLDKVYSMQDALGRAFVANYGHEALHEALRVEKSVTQDFSRMHRGLIAQLHDSIQKVAGPNARAHTQEAWRLLQSDISPADPQMQQTMRGLRSSIDLTFGSSSNGLGSFAQRNGIFPHHLNEVMDYYKVPKQFRFDTSKNWAEQADGWKTWEDVDDPLALLDSVHASMQRASVEVSLGRDFSHQFGSTTAQPGYVKIVNSGNKSKIARFIDQDRYYPEHIVEQMSYLDQVLKGSLGRVKNPNAEAIIGMYDGIIHAWKSGLTIYRPGHHVRNLIGDVTLSFFDGVTNPAVYYKATRILSRRSKAYNSWDGLKALEEGTPLGAATDAGITRVRVGGKARSLTDDQVWRAAFDQGIIPDYRTLEDIAFNQSQGMGSTSNKLSLKKPLGGKGQKLAGGLSQSRDHMVRIAHFLDIIQKGNFKTLEQAFEVAGKRVRKWHPDGSDLTNFENKVARRTFMFYSWMRKAIPLVVETLVMRPGRAMVFPKTMYAFAEANGVDLDSLGNPFPVDQLFPEFITDQVIGPQFGEAGDYGGINPGEPITEMLSQWGSSDPQHGIGGALTPVARVPIELYTGTNLGTGSSIQDKSDYADSQIPGLGYLAKITGHSVTGAGAPTKDVDRGLAEPGFNDEALINFLTGIGIRDYSKANYIKRAQLEQRDEYRRQ